MLTKLIHFLLKKYLDAAKLKFDDDCMKIKLDLDVQKDELLEKRQHLDVIKEHEISQAKKEAEKIRHDATAEAQSKLMTAAKMGDVMTVELYKKDIYGRPFFRLAPLLDEEGYKALRDNNGFMKCRLIFPDQSTQIVKLTAYKG